MAYTTRQQLIDRVLRFYYDGTPSDDAVLTSNEVDLYINDAIATVINKQSIEAYNITGIVSVPEGYVTTYELTAPVLNQFTGYYSTTLPHPPIGLPDLAGVTGVYFGGNKGQSRPILYVSSREMDYFISMPKPPQAAFYWIENRTIYFWCRTDISAISDKIYIRMATNVQSGTNDVLNVPPEAIDMVFSLVTQKLLERKKIPVDLINDGIESK